LEKYKQRMLLRQNESYNKIVKHNRKHKTNLKIVESEKLPQPHVPLNIYLNAKK
jgi:hypothetical protein